MRLRSSSERDRPGSKAALSTAETIFGTESAEPRALEVNPLLVAAYDAESPYMRHVRTIRSKILQKRSRSGSVSSCALIGFDCDREGSVLAANLAITMVNFGTPTLLIDATPTAEPLHLLFQTSNEVGVSNLTPSMALADIAQPTDFDQLWLMPVGPDRGRESNLADRQPLLSLLSRWNVPSSQIIISAAAHHPGGYASLADMVAGVDCVIVALRKHKSRIGDAQRLIDQLDERKVPIAGTVIV